MTWFCVCLWGRGWMGGEGLREGSGEQLECVCKIILNKSLFLFPSAF